MVAENKRKFIYFAFGLVLSSEVELPGLIECEQPADVDIIFGKVPRNIENPDLRRPKLQISRREILFRLGRTRFYIKDGSQVIIEAGRKPNLDLIRSCLTGPAIAVVLYQRGFIPIHGSCVVIDGKGVIFTGDSGAGKSSLCFAFSRRQHEFLSDEITVLSIDDCGEIMVLPSHPQQKVSRRILKEMGCDLPRSYENASRGKIIFSSPAWFRKQPVRLGAIFELKKSNNGVNSKKITGTDKLKRIINNIYYIAILNSMGISMDYFMKCVQIVEAVDYYLLERPKRGDTTIQQMQHIENILSGNSDTACLTRYHSVN